MIVDIDRLQKLIGRELVGGEIDQAQAIIDQVNAYLIGECGQDFTFHEDDEITIQADARGIILLRSGPVTELAEVRDGTTVLTGYRWDGLREISGLRPHQTVIVVYSHGYSTEPADICGVGASMAARQVINPVGIRQETVGGTSVTYASAFGEAGAIAPSSFERRIIDRYRDNETSWRI